MLGVVGLALMMVVSAVSGLNVALPSIARETGATQTQLTWIVDAYTTVFVGLLLAAGSLGDRYGRRRILIAGLTTFGVAAAGALPTSSPDELIALRAVMGAGAALVMPTTLSIITTSFPPQERARAVGVWVGIAGGGAVLGLLASGLLLEFFSWSSFYALNVVLAGLSLAGTVAFVPDSRDAHPPRLDPVGGLLSLAGAAGLVAGIIEGPGRGWGDPLVIGGLIGGTLALAGFVAWELRRGEPLLDPRLFRLRGFSTGALALTANFFGSFGFFFIGLQYLQYVAGLTPLSAAVALLPLPVVLIPLARLAPRMAERHGMKRVSGAGLLMAACGLAVISRLHVVFHYVPFAAGLVLFAAGMGLAATPATTAIVSSLPQAKQGVASAVNDLSREFGSALGIAVLGSVLNASYRRQLAPALKGLPETFTRHAQASVVFVERAPVSGYGHAGVRLKTTAVEAFVHAGSTALLVAAGTLLAAAAMVAAKAPGRAGASSLAKQTTVNRDCRGRQVAAEPNVEHRQLTTDMTSLDR